MAYRHRSPAGMRCHPAYVPADVRRPAPQKGVEVGDHGRQRSSHLAPAGGRADLVPQHPHRPPGRPALQVEPAAPTPRLHLAVVEAEEIEALPAPGEVDGAGLSCARPGNALSRHGSWRARCRTHSGYNCTRERRVDRHLRPRRQRQRHQPDGQGHVHGVQLRPQPAAAVSALADFLVARLDVRKPKRLYVACGFPLW
jgi:hypothetical protein